MSATQQELADFFKHNVQLTLSTLAPPADDVDVTPATRLLEKRREIAELETGLAREKDDFRIRMDMLAQRRDELARKETMLGESLTKFEKFLKDNDAKRNRAVKKAHEERRQRELKEGEIAKLREMAGQLSKARVRQERMVRQGQHYQRYLESVIEAAEGFPEIRDLLARYDTLAATNGELLERARDAQDRTERERAAFTQRCEDKNTAILNMNNAIAKLKLRLEDLEAKSAAWQVTIERSMQGATQKSLEVGQIRLATNNLFNLVKLHLHNRVATTPDTLAQLEKIQMFILDLEELV
ncbi:coiled-coil domain-containing protein 42 [Blastocladiella britannica]|nr:coiled-coil domain-containing protein 42 [Blastocladiella britannica]